MSNLHGSPMVDIGASGSPSVAIADPQVIQRFEADPNHTCMVSFPRTGSHWLRMMIELYFQRPTLTRNFYFQNMENYILIGTHDLDLSVKRRVVLYLYRDPVDTLYSIIKYYKQDSLDATNVDYWFDLYMRHLTKWLIDETFTVRKTSVRYDRLRDNTHDEFAKVVRHFEGTVDIPRIDRVLLQVTKDEVAAKVAHEDPQVIPTRSDYDDMRSMFHRTFEDRIWNALAERDDRLRSFFA